MPVGLVATVVGIGITAALLFLSGLLGLAPKNATKCVQYETYFKSYTTLITLGSLQVHEPVWDERCRYDVTLPTPEPSTAGTPLN